MLSSPHTPKLCNMGHPQDNSQELDKKYLMSKTKLPPDSFMIKRHKTLSLCEKLPYSVIRYSCSDQNTMLAVKDNNTRHLYNFSFKHKVQQNFNKSQWSPRVHLFSGPHHKAYSPIASPMDQRVLPEDKAVKNSSSR